MHTTKILILTSAALGMLLASCTEPDIEDYPTGRAWSCEAHSDCGAGWVCDGESRHCELAYDGENGVFEDRLVIGMSADFGGPVKEAGLSLRQGIEIYFDHVNNVRGGVHGRRLELVSRNDNYDPETALNNVKEMVAGDREVFAFLGNQGAPSAALTGPYLNSQGTVLFGPYTGGSETRNAPPDRFVFNFRASYSHETKAIVDYMMDFQEPNQPPENVAVFAQADNGQLDALGEAGFQGVVSSMRSHNLSSDGLFVGSYQRETTDIDDAASSFVKWLGSSDRMIFPNGGQQALVVLAAEGGPAAAFIAAVKEDFKRIQTGQNSNYGLTPEEQMQVMYTGVIFAAASSVGDQMVEVLAAKNDMMYCGWGLDQTGNIAQTGPVILSQVVPFYESGSAGPTAYREQLQAYDPSIRPGHVSLEAYLTTRLFVKALEDAGPYLNDEVLVEAIEGLGEVDLGIGVPVTLTHNVHQASNEVWGTFLDQDCVVREHPYHQQQAEAEQ